MPPRKVSLQVIFRAHAHGPAKRSIARMGFLDWLNTGHTTAPVAVAQTSADDPEIPRYPPFLRGLPVTAPARIVATQQELISNLQDGLAFSDERFNALVRPVVARYAAFVHLLPASEAHHHRGAGGLLRHGLEVAFNAARASQGLIFALDTSPGERRSLEPRWHLAAGLAGLCHDLGKPIADLSVTDREGRTTWRPLLESLTDWAAAHDVTHYYLRWRERRHRRHETFGLLVLDRILTPEVTAWLADPDPEILQGLLAAVAGIDDGAVLGRLTSAADQASVEQDLCENHIDPAAASLGVPVERYLLDAMRRLARGARWQINVPGARLWLLAEGLHVVWPAGAQDVVALLAADKVPGIPRDPDTLADILLERGLAVPREEAGRTQRYWRLAPAPLARDGQTVTLAMLRLASPELVLAGSPPAPVAVVTDGKVTAQAATPTEAPAQPPGQATAQRLPPAVRAARDPHEANPRTLIAAACTDESAAHESSNARAERAVPTPAIPARPSEGEAAAQGRHADAGCRARGQRAESWLRERGSGGATLIALGQLLARAQSAWHERVRLRGEQVLVRFPEGLAGLAASPQAALDTLAHAGLLESDPLAPLRRVQEIDGTRAARLSAEASRQVLALAGEAPATAHDPQVQQRAERFAARRGEDTAARELVARIAARDPAIPGGVRVSDGWLCVDAGVPVWFAAARPGLSHAALLRTLGRLPECRITPQGGLAVRLEP